jgi:signal recognition particle receptor subunit beta
MLAAPVVAQRALPQSPYDRLAASPAAVRLLVVGLPDSGRAGVLESMKLGEVRTTKTAAGLSFDSAARGNLTVVSFDLSNEGKRREAQRQQFKNTSAVVFVIDSSDRARFASSDKAVLNARTELEVLLGDDTLKGLPLLVFAEMRDLNNVAPVKDVVEVLGLNALGDRAWHIQESYSSTGDGIYEGFSWLESKLMKKE